MATTIKTIFFILFFLSFFTRALGSLSFFLCCCYPFLIFNSLIFQFYPKVSTLLICYLCRQDFHPFDGAKIEGFYEPTIIFWSLCAITARFVDQNQRIGNNSEFCSDNQRCAFLGYGNTGAREHCQWKEKTKKGFFVLFFTHFFVPLPKIKRKIENGQ